MGDDFEIKRTIQKGDIPGPKRTSKYESLYRSCGTLRQGEGIEAVFERKKSIVSNVKSQLKKRYPHCHFDVTGSKQSNEYHLYIVRIR
jgi:hypothetical protein